MVKILLILLLLCSPVWAGVDFDGVDDELTFTSTDTTGDHSIYVVAYMDDATGDYCVVSDSSANSGFRLWWRTANGISYSKGAIIDVSSSIAWTAGKWVAIVVTNDVSEANGITFYYREMDSSTVTTEAEDSAGAPNSNDGTGQIGTNVWGEFFPGVIAEVGIWNALLTAGEVNQLILSSVKGMGRQIQPSNLTEYFLLDDEADGSSADGDTFVDISGSGHTATGDNGGNNTGLTAKAEEVLSYP